MTNTVRSWVAIQAHIAEWQRQYRNRDFRPTDFLFGELPPKADIRRREYTMSAMGQ